MKVLIVCNNAYMRGNGICTAVLALYRRLKESGVEARLMACENSDPSGPQPEYPLKHFKFPFFEPIIQSNGFRYATFSKRTAAEAIGWSDVVHLCEGFPLEAMTVKLAQKMGKPCVGTYHLFTENIMANLGMRKARLLNYLVTLWWRRSVYDRCTHVHCPTETVKQYLLDNDFGAEMRVITNGMDVPEKIVPAEAPQEAPFVVLCIGRLAYEKSQDTLLKAMRYSKYADRIQLHFAGKGPHQKKYERLAAKLIKEGVLRYQPHFGFYNAEQLKALSRSAYLYVHCAWVEVEGLSCAEAIMEGVVPVIAEGKLTATSQFALDEHSLFPERDARALAGRIDWWIEHPEERKAMGPRYAESVRKYNAREATDQMIQMYKDSIGR